MSIIKKAFILINGSNNRFITLDGQSNTNTSNGISNRRRFKQYNVRIVPTVSSYWSNYWIGDLDFLYLLLYLIVSTLCSYWSNYWIGDLDFLYLLLYLIVLSKPALHRSLESPHTRFVTLSV